MSRQRGIPESIIEEIKQRNEIVSVVAQYVKLDKKSSQNLFGLCPFHSEDTPSFSVSPGKQIYYCFGCHKGGDVIHFIMDMEKVGYLDAIKILAEKAKIEIPASDDHEYQKKVELAKKLYAANTEAARYFYMNLTGPQGAGVRDYLRKRGIDSNTAKRFGLGYAINEWDGLYKHLRSKGYPDDIIFLTGLFKRRSNSATGKESPDGMYDLFRNRLMFPILDYLGKIVAFGGRVMDDTMPKYINSPETPVYIKGRHLYGFQIAKSSRAPQLIVVEGYMDAIAMHQAGIDNAVASLGTALTEQQAVLVRKHSENVIIAYDSDAAGQTATLRGLEILTRKGCKVSVLCLPEGKDPDEYIKKNGPERFAALLKDAMPLMDYKLWSASNAAMQDGSFDRIIYQDLACNILAQEENKIIRELYSMKVAEKLGVPLDPVLSEIERRIKPKANDHSNQSNPLRPKIIQEEIVEEYPDEAKATKDELRFLCLLSVDPRIYPSLQPAPDIKYFSAGMMQMIAESAFTLAAQKKLTSSALVEIGEDNLVNNRKLSELFANGCMKIGEEINLKKAIAESRILYIKMQISKNISEMDLILKSESIMQKSDPANISDENKRALLALRKEITSLRSKMEQINTTF